LNDINKYFEFLYKLERSGMKYDLRNITSLLKALGNPHKTFRSVHIAGTNGKGATASFAASILAEHGFKTGLFTSPHILRFNERIRINGKCISDTYIRRFLDRHRKLIMKIKPSFFEVNTALAFNYFADNRVDAAVVEAGLGGRLDSTNILKPDASVITQIGMDHMQYLGNTLKEITKEKLGIIKKNTPLIVSDNRKVLKPLFSRCVNKTQLHYLDDEMKLLNVKESSFGIDFRMKYKGISLLLNTPLLGKYQARNAGAAVLAAKLFAEKNGFLLSTELIKKGVKNVKANSGYRGRLEEVTIDRVKYILDVSHNPDGIKESIKSLSSRKIDLVIFGIMEDKDYKRAFRIIVNGFRNIIVTRPDYLRSLDPQKLVFLAKRLRCNDAQTISTLNVKEAISLIKNAERKPGTVLIIGSFFLVSDAIKALKLERHFL
jgi:dihydrofolate synthase / folylpolyglutamate synthase